MVKKIGQRKFLLKRGYFEGELDKMSPSEAKRIIASIEKIEHPQGQRKVYSEKEVNAIKEFVGWYRMRLEHIQEHEKELLDDDVKHEYSYLAEYRKGVVDMLDRLLFHIYGDLEKFLEERK